ncbi:MAG: 2-C-methyl-D-erythritol 2,4-cyclodiphosphate synthase [PVC group bacterium]
MRVGIGYDIHRLAKGRRLVLGGVEIPCGRGLLGHSDADALTHAVCDALLGAAGLGDIGRHFPDTDQRYRGISSLKLLATTVATVRAAGFEVENIDVTVVLQEPRLAPLIREMEETLAGTLGIEASRINVKAATNEGLDAVGRGEAIAAWAAACVAEKHRA